MHCTWNDRSQIQLEAKMAAFCAEICCWCRNDFLFCKHYLTKWLLINLEMKLMDAWRWSKELINRWNLAVSFKSQTIWWNCREWSHDVDKVIQCRKTVAVSASLVSLPFLWLLFFGFFILSVSSYSSKFSQILPLCILVNRCEYPSLCSCKIWSTKRTVEQSQWELVSCQKPAVSN